MHNSHRTITLEQYASRCGKSINDLITEAYTQFETLEAWCQAAGISDFQDSEIAYNNLCLHSTEITEIVPETQPSLELTPTVTEVIAQEIITQHQESINEPWTTIKVRQ